MPTSTIRVKIPASLRTLAYVNGDLELTIEGPVTPAAIVDRIESLYPMLAGTIRDHNSGKRRAYLRFFAAGSDVSMDPMNAPLPQAVVEGKEPFIILGAISGG